MVVVGGRGSAGERGEGRRRGEEGEERGGKRDGGRGVEGRERGRGRRERERGGGEGKGGGGGEGEERQHVKPSLKSFRTFCTFRSSHSCLVALVSLIQTEVQNIYTVVKGLIRFSSRRREKNRKTHKTVPRRTEMAFKEPVLVGILCRKTGEKKR